MAKEQEVDPVVPSVAIRINSHRYLQWPKGVPGAPVYQAGDVVRVDEQTAKILCGEGQFDDGTIPVASRLNEEI